MRSAAYPLLPSARVRTLVALMAVAGAPGCGQLLGISDPTPADRVDGGVDAWGMGTLPPPLEPLPDDA